MEEDQRIDYRNTDKMQKKIERVMVYLWIEVRNEYVRSGIMVVLNDRRWVIVWLSCTDD